MSLTIHVYSLGVIVTQSFFSYLSKFRIPRPHLTISVTKRCETDHLCILNMSNFILLCFVAVALPKNRVSHRFDRFFLGSVFCALTIAVRMHVLRSPHPAYEHIAAQQHAKTQPAQSSLIYQQASYKYTRLLGNIIVLFKPNSFIIYKRNLTF